ncbi:MAG: hypothetical protein V4649_19765 [Bacteroidota bacterium]
MAKKTNPRKKNKAFDNEPDIRPSFYPGSTTQGGSNFGQGSSNLGNKSAKQGDSASSGANYDNERWEADDVNTGNDAPPKQK